MFFCPSVINKGVGFCLPSLGEGLGVGVSLPSLGEGRGWVSVPLPWGGVGGGYQFPSLGERLRVGELRSGMRPGVGVSYAPKGH